MSDIQVILGHQDITTTQRYATFARPDLAQKMEKLENVLPFRKVSGN
jgi:site-specific recombinase XerD